jgi:hypothetical protein
MYVSTYLLVGGDGILGLVECVASSLLCLLQRVARAILGLPGLVLRCSRCIRRSLLCLVGLVPSCSLGLLGLALGGASSILFQNP